MTDAPELHVRPARRSWRDRISFIWVVPIGALLVSLAVFWQSFASQGPMIEIAFDNASGVKANETVLKYRDVQVGVVESVSFSDNLGSVLVHVRVDKDVAEYVDADAQFWVVRPEVTAQGVSGLDTVLSGVFIEGTWNNEKGEPQSRFDGLPKAPLVRSDQQGTAITLRTSSSKGLGEGTPILYRGIEVGRVANLRLSDDGVSVLADGFIRAPEDRLLTSATRFWDTSGFSFSFGAQGAQLNVSSLASLVSGGVAFETLVSGGNAVDDGATFQLYDDEDSARASLFTDGAEGVTLNLAVIFEGAVSGLTNDADVEFQGIKVGKVTAITGLVDPDRFGDNAVRLLATLELSTSKLGLPADATEESALRFMQDAVRRGYRAQLQNASLLTGGLKVAILLPDTIGPQPSASIDMNGEPYPILPSIPAEISDFADTAEGVFNRINNLPIEELLSSAVDVLDSVNVILSDDNVKRTPEEVLALLNDVRSFVGSEQVQGLPVQASDMIATLNEGANEFEAILQSVREAGTVQALTDALNAASDASEAVIASVADVPELITSIEEVAASADNLMTTANNLPLDELLTRASTLLTSADTLVNSEGVQQLPVQLGAAIQEAQGAIADVRSSGVIEQVGSTLTSTEQAVQRVTEALLPVIDAAEQTVAQANTSLQGVPQLIERIDGVAQSADALLVKADQLPLDDLVNQANDVIASANALLNDPGTKALPGQLESAVRQAQGAITDIRTSGLIAGANDALITTSAAVQRITDALMPVLDSARTAADSLSAATSDLPALVERANGIATQLEELANTAADLPLEELANRATDLVNSANTLISSTDSQAVPAALNGALAQVEAVLAEARAGGLIENANSTLAAAERAAGSIATTSDNLPELLNRMNRLLAEAETVISGYSSDGTFGSETRSTLREIRDAANSVNSLARAIERNPNSLLFGR
ncbi:PqiB family protein [Oceaniglobus roseus]|uniref:PqiB family protein n=1 Tax=Oceaniglobus roseus TaxID=1737570 RepID=UPI000C7F19CF|nr:MlaD family protein [Kandeliimicrobium roseum]